jgi:hypothetical protein
MSYLAYILIPIEVGAMLSLAKKESDLAVQDNDSNVFMMRLPKVYLWVGAVCSLFFVALFILMLLFPNDTASVWVGVVFLFFFAMGLAIIIACVKWRMWLYHDHFIYRTMFGKIYEYAYSQIKSAKLTQNALTIKLPGKTFMIDPHAVGVREMLGRLHENHVEVS